MDEYNNTDKKVSSPSIEEIKAKQAREAQAEKDRQTAVYLATKYMSGEEKERVWTQFEKDEKRRDTLKRLERERQQRLKNMHI